MLWPFFPNNLAFRIDPKVEIVMKFRPNKRLLAILYQLASMPCAVYCRHEV